MQWYQRRLRLPLQGGQLPSQARGLDRGGLGLHASGLRRALLRLDLLERPIKLGLEVDDSGLVWAPVRTCWFLGGLEMQALRRLGRSAAVWPDRPMPRKPLKTRLPTRRRRVRDDGFEEKEGRIYSMARPAEFMHFQTGADTGEAYSRCVD